jgi:hypothetical protein
MNDLTRNILVILLALLGLFTSFWSFKMHLNLFSSTGFSKNFIHHTESKTNIIWHNILNSGVCPFGKLGAWIIIGWSLAIIITISLTMSKNLDEDVKNKIYDYLGYGSLALLVSSFVLSWIMNFPLAIRSLPFYFVESAMVVLLLTRN